MYGTKIVKVHQLSMDIHLAALVNVSHTEDDGYGNYETIDHIQYISFDDETELQAWIIDAISNKLTYQIIRVQPAKVNIKTIISVE